MKFGKKSVIALAVIAVAIVGLYFLNSKEENPNTDISQSNNKISEPKSKSKLVFKTNQIAVTSLFNTPQKTQLTEIKEAVGDNNRCDIKVKTLALYSSVEFNSSIVTELPTLNEDCFANLNNTAGNILEQLRKSCSKDDSNFSCSNSLGKLRSKLIDASTADVEYTELSTHTLVHKIFAKNKDKPSKTELEERLKLVNEVEKRDPNLGYSKLKTILLDELESLDSTYLQDAAEYMSALYSAEPDEWLKIKFKKFKSLGKQSENDKLLANFLTDHPRSATAYYLKGVQAFLYEDLVLAKKNLDQAVSIDPQDFFIQEGRNGLIAKGLDWQAPYQSASFNFSLAD